MKSLHIFPLFGSELMNGSEHYEFMLSKALVEQGVAVDVFATRSNRIRLESAFSTAWPNDYPAGVERVAGMTVERFPVTFQWPTALGSLFSQFILNRWGVEERIHGAMLRGSLRQTDYFVRRGLTRPWIYDALARAGLGPWSWPMLKRLQRVVRQYDVVLAGFMPFSLLPQVVWIAHRQRVPVVLLPLFHPDDLYHYSTILSRALADADGLLTLTPYSTELIGRLWPQSRPRLVGAGVDLEDFLRPTVSGERFRTTHGLGQRRIVLYVGRKEPGKRYDLALQAVDLLGRDDVMLVMIGADADGIALDSPNVLYLNVLPRADLIDAYDACDVLIMPSEHESFGMVILEAWVRGKPVIGNRSCGPVASLIQEGRDGFLCDTVEDFSRRLCEVLGDADLAHSLGAHGKAKVLERYNWRAVADRVLDVYRSVIADGTNRAPAG